MPISDWHPSWIQPNQVGPRHAITAYFRSIHEVSTTPITQDGGWLERLCAQTARPMGRDMLQRSLECLSACRSSPAILSLRAKTRKSLGKDVHDVALLRSEHVNLTEMGGDSRVDQAVAVTRDYVTIRNGRIDVSMTPPYLAFTRHALERIHEREHCPTGGVADEMRTRMVEADGHIAYALSSGLWIKTPGEGEGGTFATALVPFGNGLIVVAAVVTMQREIPGHRPIERAEIRKGGYLRHPMAFPQAMRVEDAAPREGITYCLLHIAKTYLSEDILRPDQIAYRDLFLEASAKHDLRSLADRTFAPVHEHAKPDLPRIPHPPRLRQLLERSVQPHPMPMMWSVERIRGAKTGGIIV